MATLCLHPILQFNVGLIASWLSSIMHVFWASALKGSELCVSTLHVARLLLLLLPGQPTPPLTLLLQHITPLACMLLRALCTKHNALHA
jgi:hypothetical protein